MLHLDIPTPADLDRLLSARADGSVSIYVPTSPLPGESDAGRIELKNLAREAATRSESNGVDRKAAAAVSDALAAFDDDEGFWAYQARSLAVFASPSHVTTFRLPNRLTSMVVVADRFHAKPLLRAVTFPQAAFVLALAQGSVRLLEVGPDLPPSEIRVDDLPTDVASAVGKSSIKDRSETGRLQGSEGQKVRMTQYARQIDAAIRPILLAEPIPLILAATDPMGPIFRSVSSATRLLPDGIAGNPEARSDGDLAAAARPILDAAYAQELAELRERFDLRASQGRTSLDVVDVARAATFGAVDTVYVDIDEVVPGSIDETSGLVTLVTEGDPSGYGVIDEIARRTLASGGRVLAVRRDDIPGGGSVAAILRFPV